MIVNGLKTHNNCKNPSRIKECEYPSHHKQEVDKEIYTYLVENYGKKGRNFFFRASQLPFPDLSGQRKGAALRRICENTQTLEKWNTGQIIVWYTKFMNDSK